MQAGSSRQAGARVQAGSVWGGGHLGGHILAGGYVGQGGSQVAVLVAKRQALARAVEAGQGLTRQVNLAEGYGGGLMDLCCVGPVCLAARKPCWHDWTHAQAA